MAASTHPYVSAIAPALSPRVAEHSVDHGPLFCPGQSDLVSFRSNPPVSAPVLLLSQRRRSMRRRLSDRPFGRDLRKLARPPTALMLGTRTSAVTRLLRCREGEGSVPEAAGRAVLRAQACL
jgi:hypothetical protein